jgi:hypothetical protein
LDGGGEGNFTLVVHACFYGIFIVGLGGVFECFAQALRRGSFDFSQLLHLIVSCALLWWCIRKERKKMRFEFPTAEMRLSGAKRNVQCGFYAYAQGINCLVVWPRNGRMTLVGDSGPCS